jgi:hypothetical protein
MSRGWDPWTERPLPEVVRVAYPLTTVETAVFSYDAAQAEREKRTVAIRFAAGDADVLSADTEGYCGLGATFLGHYRRVREH